MSLSSFLLSFFPFAFRTHKTLIACMRESEAQHQQIRARERGREGRKEEGRREEAGRIRSKGVQIPEPLWFFFSKVYYSHKDKETPFLSRLFIDVDEIVLFVACFDFLTKLP